MSRNSNTLYFLESGNRKLQNVIDTFSNGTADVALCECVKLIDEGYDEAYAFAGAIYEFGGNNVECNYHNAIFYYEQSIERFGSIEAYLGLIRIYYYGKGVTRNCCKALEYCDLLVKENDNMYANYIMGKIYMDGCCVDVDMNIAKKCFENSWDRGYVFGLTKLAMLEQLTGSRVKSWLMRLKAAVVAFRITRNNPNDPRIREI